LKTVNSGSLEQSVHNEDLFQRFVGYSFRIAN